MSHGSKRKSGLQESSVDAPVKRGRSTEALDWQVALMELSLEPIFVWDWKDGIVEWNAGAEVQYGFNRSEALGQILRLILRKLGITSRIDIVRYAILQDWLQDN